MLAEGERVTWECKKAQNAVPISLWNTYSVFANTINTWQSKINFLIKENACVSLWKRAKGNVNILRLKENEDEEMLSQIQDYLHKTLMPFENTNGEHSIKIDKHILDKGSTNADN